MSESKTGDKEEEGKVGGGDAKGETAPVPLTDDELITKVQEFFYGSQKLANMFENFIKDECHIVDLSNEEYKLEYTSCFHTYRSLFEEEMEGFITRELHVDVKAFYYALKNKMDKDEMSNEAIFGQILIAVTDFDVFMTMMREAARENLKRGK